MVADVSIEESPVGPVVSTSEDADLTILYLHNGREQAEPVLDTATTLAVLTGSRVVCPRYRKVLRPAINDAHTAYGYCQTAGAVVVVGEGIGAALATTLLGQLRDMDATPPRCAILLSALLDMTLQTKSLLFNGDPGFDLAALRQRVADYARNTPLTDPQLSPLYANLHGLPPLRLLVAGTDPLLDDSLAFAARAARSRVAVDLRVWPEAASFRAEAIAAIAEHLRTQTAAAPSAPV